MKKSDHITSILHSITKKNVNENKHFILNNQKKNISLKNFKKKNQPKPIQRKKKFFSHFFFLIPVHHVTHSSIQGTPRELPIRFDGLSFPMWEWGTEERYVRSLKSLSLPRNWMQMWVNDESKGFEGENKIIKNKNGNENENEKK